MKIEENAEEIKIWDDGILVVISKKYSGSIQTVYPLKVV